MSEKAFAKELDRLGYPTRRSNGRTFRQGIALAVKDEGVQRSAAF
ncbi:hypothetical protein SCMU_27710 [Sinomonas cyclohexanicum]|uniref:Uncharacterized protein n=1 Tax=Sinomonas cyclohexanicum TaxID=322009 RepID=A0ABN6FJV1_SINCY|nr:hypothetical protein SCMU_27710 [Corynebacterium cyclohexanicum]